MRKHSKNEIPKLKARAWKAFSEWVRRNEKGICFTCGDTKNWKLQQAGHYIHGRLDYDPMNVHCQCIACNHFKHGNLGVYGEKMIDKYGFDSVQELRLRSNKIWKPSRYEIEAIEEHWKSELEKMQRG